MAKRNKVVKALTEKEPSELAGSNGSCDNVSDYSPLITDSITENAEQSSDLAELDGKKGRHFWFLVYPSKEYLEKYYPDCPYDGRSGYGTAPDDWMEQLRI